MDYQGYLTDMMMIFLTDIRILYIGITNRRTSEADASPPAVPAPAPAPRAAHNPFAVERPHAAPHLLERQGSFRGFAHLNNKLVVT